MPLKILIRVDLPAPFSPMMPRTSPEASSRLISLSTRTPENSLTTFSALSRAVLSATAIFPAAPPRWTGPAAARAAAGLGTYCFMSPSKATSEGEKFIFFTNWADSSAPNSRSMPLSSHSTESGPP